MTHPVPIHFRPVELDQLSRLTGRIVAFADAVGSPSLALRRLDRLTKGAVDRALASPAFDKLKPGEGMELAWPAGRQAAHRVSDPGLFTAAADRSQAAAHPGRSDPRHHPAAGSVGHGPLISPIDPCIAAQDRYVPGFASRALGPQSADRFLLASGAVVAYWRGSDLFSTPAPHGSRGPRPEVVTWLSLRTA